VPRIGEEFDGTISGVTAFGIFVALDAVYVEGLVHVSELGADYFQFDNIKHQILGERTGQRFRLGDRVRVKLVRADLESNRIDFVLSGSDKAYAGRRTVPKTVVKTASQRPLAKAAANAVPAKAQAKPAAKKSVKPATKSVGKSSGKKSAAKKSATSGSKQVGAKPARKAVPKKR
jgi:ribonuclease R